MPDLRIGSLFSGIGGLELGLERAGVGRVVWQAEIDPDCRARLSDHWPDVHRFTDVRDVNAGAPPVDLLCGGFPCQDVSSAGKRAGLEGKRSGLWREFERAVGTLRPRWVVVENVNSGAAAWLPFVRRDLWARGYASVPVLLRAGPLGGLHDRARVFVVADADSIVLRVKPGRREWARRIEAALRAVVGADGSASDAGCPGLEVGQGRPGDVAGRKAEKREAVGGVGGDGGAATAHASDPHGQGQLQPQGLKRDERGRVGHCVVEPDRVQGAAEPALVCPVHGLPDDVAGRSSSGRPARIRALGNSVIPAMAEVIGRLIVDLEMAAQRGAP